MIDTTTLIFDQLFTCRIKYVDILSSDEIREFGMPTVFDPGIDREMANSWNTIMIPIVKMVNYHREGIMIKVVNREDVKKIYTNISSHLSVWKAQIEKGINIGDAPIEDLIAMDEFANTVYEHAKFQFTRETASSLLASHMSSIITTNKYNFLKKKTEVQTDINGNDIITINGETIPERESMSDIFKNTTIGIRRWNSK